MAKSLRVFGCEQLEEAGFIENEAGSSTYHYKHPDLMGGVEVSLKCSCMGSKESVNMFILFHDKQRAETTGILPDEDGKHNMYKFTTQKSLKTTINRLFVKRAGK